MLYWFANVFTHEVWLRTHRKGFMNLEEYQYGDKKNDYFGF